MAFLLPPRLHRFALKTVHLLRMAWWQVRRPELHGCNAIVVNAAGEILLVRHSYQWSGVWMLPGGGIKRGESAETTAIREILEETGCALVDARCFGSETMPLGAARNHIHLVHGRTADTPHADGREILEARFFAIGALPSNVTAAALRRIGRWRGEGQNSES